MKLPRKILGIVCIGCLLAGTNLLAEEKSAQNILDKAYQYIGSMDKYAFTAVMTEEEADVGGVVKKYQHQTFVKVDRPGQLLIETKGDAINRTKYLNNGLFTMMDYEYGFYGQFETPKTINGTLDTIFKNYSMNAPLAHFMYSDMSKRLKFSKSKYFGIVTVDGVECDYIAFRAKKSEVHIWIATGDKPLVKNYSIINKNIEGSPRINTSLIWDTHSKISNSDFIFVAPKDASKVLIHTTN